MHLSMKFIGSSVTDSEAALDAVFRNPKLLKMKPQLIKNTLPALATILRSEHLALNTIVKNPELLRYDPKQFQEVIPVLNQQLGGLYDAAYAIAVCPELLNVVRPQQYRETFQALEDCLGTRDDAVWTMMQTVVPLTITVTARPWYC